MALSGVRSSWPILEELRFVLARLFELPAFVLDFVEQPDVFDGVTAWSAKVMANSICFSVNACTFLRAKMMTPIGVPSRRSGIPKVVCKPALFDAPIIVYSESACKYAI